MQAQLLAQNQAQEVITSAQSVAAVKTLVTAGFGCMTFLRGLLPDENFEDARLSSTGTSLDGELASSSQSSQKNASGVRIKTVKRGYTSEGDQMLDYLEKGVFDALEKQYLQSFVFAIYLDKADPTNIVEAWSFNFRYHKVEGTSAVVPVFSLDKAMAGVSLAGDSDPIMSAALKGRHITLGEVKRSVKNLIRALITASQGLEVLPLRRHATFKIFYNSNTPQDYEPPYFVPVDPTTSSFVFTTHNPSESPEKIHLGSLDTPFHGVTLDIASIASFIPNSEDNSAQFSGLSPSHSSLPSSFADLSQTRQRATKAQIEDARNRHIVWDADAPARPKSDDDEDEVSADTEGDDFQEVPLGVRGPDGVIQSLPAILSVKKSMRNEDREFNYSSQTSDKVMPSPRRDGTPTEVNVSQEECQVSAVREESISVEQPIAQKETNISEVTSGIDTQHLKEVMIMRKYGDHNPNPHQSPTQQVEDDPIGSFSTPSEPIELSRPGATNEDEIMDDPSTPKAGIIAPNVMDSQITVDETQAETQATNTRATQVQSGMDPDDDELTTECDCGSKTSEVDWIRCDTCHRWLHIWCMGFHNDKDSKIPNRFQCFPCELREDPNSSLLDENQFEAAVSSWKALALFRRCLQAVRDGARSRPETSPALRKRIGISAQVVGQVWKRLEAEGFICSPQVFGDLLERLGGASSSVKPNAKRGRPATRRVPVLNRGMNAAFERYFDPRGELEIKALGLDTLRGKLRGPKCSTDSSFISLPNAQHASGDNHAIEDAEMGPLAPSEDSSRDPIDSNALQGMKRKPEDLGSQAVRNISNGTVTGRGRKRLKISMAFHPLDLEEF